MTASRQNISAQAQLSYFKWVLSLFYIFLLAPALATKVSVRGGGYGGNWGKQGLLIYDGLPFHMPFLEMERDDETQTCFLQNDYVKVYDYQNEFLEPKSVSHFSCNLTDSAHNYVYWNDVLREQCGAFSQANDALFGGSVISHMFHEWYGMSPLRYKNGVAAQILLYVNIPLGVEAKFQNFKAYFSNTRLASHGPCSDEFYPQATFRVIAHEVGHGISADCFSMDTVEGKGLEEAFCDITSIAVDYYHLRSTSWALGEDVTVDQLPVRKMNEAVAYDPRMFSSDSHVTAKVFNYFFYFLATHSGWNIRKAYDVMLYASIKFWSEETHFAGAACGAWFAASCLNYDAETVAEVAHAIGFSLSNCTKVSACSQTLFKKPLNPSHEPVVKLGERESFLRYARG
jgi:pseudolysin